MFGGLAAIQNVILLSKDYVQVQVYLYFSKDEGLGPPSTTMAIILFFIFESQLRMYEHLP